MSEHTKEPWASTTRDLARASKCYQACEDIPDAALQPGSVKRLLEAARKLRRVFREDTEHECGGESLCLMCACEDMDAALAPFLGKEEE